MTFLPHAGYAWQGINTFDVGLRVFTLGVHENFSVMANAIFFRQHVTYASPELKLRYFKPLVINDRLSPAGFAFAVSYWTTEVLSVREHRITPEIAFVFNQRLDICYGYNIPVSNVTIDFISTNRFGIRLIVD